MKTKTWNDSFCLICILLAQFNCLLRVGVFFTEQKKFEFVISSSVCLFDAKPYGSNCIHVSRLYIMCLVFRKDL